ncbi:MAG: chromosome segregation protein SMC [Clostridia bacterium]|nr:chromosome segregation protein SMC [Clostridia bacterium]
MRLKTLEMQGFKSFPDKTVIRFDRGITVVVGPNGSGKSNISDAMRWVLGEVSSKNIRGGKMEDVVFAGSQKRSAMNYAEVSVTFDNSEESGKIASLSEYDEITVTRRYYRVGESEYFINRRPVRLRDIHELFMNTGLGRDGYSIIGQGRIAEIISQKNDERRAIFEEAAGIAKYRYQKNEAQKKLENTDENLVRLTDIADVLGARVGPLAAEAEKAKQYLTLREEKMALDIAISVFDIGTVKAASDEMNGKLLLANEELAGVEEENAALETDEERERARDMETKIEAERLTAEVMTLTAELHENETSRSLLQNDIAHLRETISSADARMAVSREGIAEGERECASLTLRLDEARRGYEALEASLTQTEGEISTHESDLSVCAGLSAVWASRVEELRREETNAVVEASVASAKREADGKRRAELAESIAKHEGDVRMLDERLETARVRIADYEKREAAVDARLATLARAHEENATQSRALSEKKNSLFLEMSQRKHKIQNLVRMEELLEGYSGAVRFIVNEHKGGRVRLPDGQPVTLYGPVSKLITVPDAYSVALEIAFGQNLQNIVVGDEASAKAAIAYLKKKNAGRATFYPVTTMRGTEINTSEIPTAHREGFVAVASALVSCDPMFRGIIRSLLGRILIAKDMESAAALAKAMNFRYRVVTLDGQVVNAGGSFTGGSLYGDGRMLSRRVQIEKLTEEVKALEREHAETEKAIRALSDKEDELRKTESGIRASSAGLRTMHGAEQTQFTVLSSNRDAMQTALDALREEYDALSREVERMDAGIGDMTKRRSAFEEELARAQREQEDLRHRQSELTETLDEAKERLTALTVERAKADASLAMLTQMHESAAERLDALGRTLAELTQTVDDAEKKIAEHEEKTSALLHRADEIQAALAAVQEKRTAVAARASAIEQSLSQIRVKARELANKRDLAYRVCTKLESECGGLRDRLDKLTAFLWDEYELTYSEASRRVTAPVTAETRPTAVIEQNQYKNRLKALGHVNVNAIEEYKDVKGRYDEMTSQIDDLRRSKESLVRIIAALEETMCRDFSATVETINIHFGRVFSTLFGGGHAELRLTDPEHVLESGIEIRVAPPGKVIKNMSLLSGGEQAFVAIALYFSILEVNPSPFCILDEIEAALDEVNVDKFADYVKKYSEKTQFVIITHRRGTMEAAERLYGVTMHEKGISDVISVDLSELEQKIGLKPDTM